MLKNLKEGFNWIESYTNLEKKTNTIKRYYRLDRMFSLLEAFGNPEKSFKTIHLAGSKGKGSTAVMIAAGLHQGGYKTGLYTSPHLVCYQERIRINQEILDDSVYLKQINRIYERITPKGVPLPGGDEPTTFELLTLLGYLVFADQKCHWAVIETGLGGRLDATNTLVPVLSVITPIEKEHTQWLGNTLKEIAAEKAGIIKKTVPVISAGQEAEVKKVIIEKCDEKETEVTFVFDHLNITDVHIGLEGTSGLIQWDTGMERLIQLRMIGQIQLNNAATALLSLQKVFPESKPQTWIEGFKEAFLPGRMQILSKDPLIIADGAHTPNSLRLTIQAFRDLSQDSNAILLFACGDDKNAKEMAHCTLGYFSHVIITKPGTFKKSNPRIVLDAFQDVYPQALLIDNPEDALKAAREQFPDSPLLITGSFFLAGDLIGFYKGQPASTS